MTTISSDKRDGEGKLVNKFTTAVSTQSTESVLAKVLSEVRLGLVSSVVAEAALFPLDVVKLQQQVNGGAAAEVFRHVLSQQGLFGLYRGLWGRLIQTITSNVGFFIWQTLLMQLATPQVADGEQGPRKLGTVVTLVVNMLAQQVNRVLTTPIDVVANVNQADPNSKGFFHTFAKVARTGGRPVLWRGLAVALLLSFNPALMFTLVGKLTTFVQGLRGGSADAPLGATDMFWISGVSKMVATLVTYPLIRAKAVVQSTTKGTPPGLWVMLATIGKRDGMSGLYQGVWTLSFKTVLFNSMMMSLKQKLSIMDQTRAKRSMQRRRASFFDAEWKDKVVPLNGAVKPWEAAMSGKKVVYVDGSWTFLHAAQEHILREAEKRGDYLLVGVHSDSDHHSALGAYPKECFSARVARIHAHPLVSAVLEEAPWAIADDAVQQLGIGKVVSGTITKMADGASPEATGRPGPNLEVDPYLACKRQGIFEEVASLNESTENSVWMDRVARVLFSNVDASIDWRILVNSPAGERPGYTAPSRGRQLSDPLGSTQRQRSV